MVFAFLFIANLVVLAIVSCIVEKIKNSSVKKIIIALYIVAIVVSFVGSIVIDIDCKRNTVVSNETGEIVRVSSGRYTLEAEFNIDGKSVKVSLVGLDNLDKGRELPFKKVTYRDKYYWYVPNQDYYEDEDYNILHALIDFNKIFKVE